MQLLIIAMVYYLHPYMGLHEYLALMLIWELSNISSNIKDVTKQLKKE